MKMKRINAVLICIALLLAVLPTPVFAAEVSASSMNDITTAADGDYIRLANNITWNEAEDVTISNKSLTIDLNGYTLSFGIHQLIFNGAATNTLTITDTSVAGGGLLTSNNTIYDNTIGSPTGGTITLSGAGGLKIQGKCTIKNTSYVAIYNAGTAPITMTGGTVESVADRAIYHNGTGSITITGGQIKGPVILQSGIVNTTILSLSNCTIISTNDQYAAIENLGSGKVILGTGSIVQGSYDVIYNGVSQAGTIEINGGTIGFTGTLTTQNRAAITNYEYGILTMSAGSVNASQNTKAIDNYGTCTINGGSVTSVTGLTIDNSNTTATLTIGGTALIESTGYRAISTTDGTLTVNDNVVIKGGGYSAIKNEGGAVTINGGTVEGVGVSAIDIGGTTSICSLTVNGGTLKLSGTPGAAAYVINHFDNSNTSDSVTVANVATISPEGKLYPLTADPIASLNSAEISGNSVTFSLTNRTSYTANTRFVVFDAALNGNIVSNIITTYDNATGVLTLSGSGLIAGSYHIAAYDRNLGKGYSNNRLAITVTGLAQSVTPTVNEATVYKTTAPQSSVDYTLTNTPLPNGTWSVYDVTTGGNALTDITASVTGTTLTLSHATDLPTRTYYVSVTEANKAESNRLALQVRTHISNPTVKISGVILNKTTPYFSNNGQIYATEPDVWNAWLEQTDGVCTLHLSNLSLTSDMDKAIEISGTEQLYIKLEGPNIITSTNDSNNPVALYAPLTTDLILYGSGSLTVTARGQYGIAIKAKSIQLQHPVTLTANGDTQATNVKVGFLAGTYTVTDSSTNEIADYNSLVTRYELEAYVHFAPKTVVSFPVWVSSIQVTSNNMSDVLGNGDEGATVTYIPANGPASAKLILNGATISSYNTYGSNRVGILAESEPLLISLKGTNNITFQTSPISSNPLYGIYAQKALTIEAENEAELNVNITLSVGPQQSSLYALYSEEDITLSQCVITDPNDATWHIVNQKQLYPKGNNGTALNSLTIASPTYRVALSESGTYTFHSLSEGYTSLALTPLTVTVQNTGNQPSGALNIALSGDDHSSFTLSKTQVNSLTPNGTDSFTIVPVSNLGAKTYTATITISAASGNPHAIETQRFTVQVVVNPTYVATPVFQLAEGSYPTAQSVSISCATPGATLRYTTDGNEPTASSPIYSAPIPVSVTTTIKAKAFKSGLTASHTAQATYTIAPIQYQIIQGQNGTWRKGSNTGLGFTVDADHRKLASVSVDGDVITSDKYATQSGSTIVTLHSAYLATLSVGPHTLRVSFNDGYAETTFTIQAETIVIPVTVDSSQQLFWGCLLGFMILSFLYSQTHKQKKHHN